MDQSPFSQLQTGKQWPNTFQRLENKRWSRRGTERGNRGGEKGTLDNSEKSNDGKITFSSLNYLYSESKWYIIWWSWECSLLLKQWNITLAHLGPILGLLKWHHIVSDSWFPLWFWMMVAFVIIQWILLSVEFHQNKGPLGSMM